MFEKLESCNMIPRRVEPAVARWLPHRPGRAGLPHPVLPVEVFATFWVILALGFSGRPGEDFAQPLSILFPGQRLLAASAVELVEPGALCVVAVRRYGTAVASDAVVGVVALHFAPQGLPLLLHAVVSVRSHPVAQLDERSAEPVARGVALDDGLAFARVTPVMREA